MLELGVQIAAPVLAATLLMDLILGLLGKASPQMPLMLLGPAVKSMLGVLILAATIGFWPRLFRSSLRNRLLTPNRFCTWRTRNHGRREQNRESDTAKAKESPRARPGCAQPRIIECIGLGRCDGRDRMASSRCSAPMARAVTECARHVHTRADLSRRAGPALDRRGGFALDRSCAGRLLGDCTKRRHRTRADSCSPPESLAFKPERLSPANKLKQMFSLAGLSGILKSLVPFPVIAWIGISTVKKNWQSVIHASDVGVRPYATFLVSIMGELCWKSGLVLLAWSGVDYLLIRQKLEGDLKMSHQDLQEEMKQTDGNPATKGRIRRIQRANAPASDAAGYRKSQRGDHQPHALCRGSAIRNGMEAPIVVAKGRNLLAQEIKEVARWNDVPITGESSARPSALRTVEVGQPIPGRTLCCRRGNSWRSYSVRKPKLASRQGKLNHKDRHYDDNDRHYDPNDKVVDDSCQQAPTQRFHRWRRRRLDRTGAGREHGLRHADPAARLGWIFCWP